MLEHMPIASAVTSSRLQLQERFSREQSEGSSRIALGGGGGGGGGALTSCHDSACSDPKCWIVCSMPSRCCPPTCVLRGLDLNYMGLLPCIALHFMEWSGYTYVAWQLQPGWQQNSERAKTTIGYICRMQSSCACVNSRITNYAFARLDK